MSRRSTADRLCSAIITGMATYYEWYVLETSPSGRERRRKLRWRMTQEEAVSWAAANAGKRLEMVPMSGEERHTGELEGS